MSACVFLTPEGEKPVLAGALFATWERMEGRRGEVCTPFDSLYFLVDLQRPLPRVELSPLPSPLPSFTKIALWRHRPRIAPGRPLIDVWAPLGTDEDVIRAAALLATLVDR